MDRKDLTGGLLRSRLHRAPARRAPRRRPWYLLAAALGTAAAVVGLRRRRRGTHREPATTPTETPE